jgi:tRNA G26 N,N-dimethylase Trm1
MKTGVGTQLHGIFTWWGFHPTGRCRCHEKRLYYDQKGPLWCQEHLDEIVEEILEEARKREITISLQNILPALSLALPETTLRRILKRIVQVCINRTLQSPVTDAR